MIPRTIHVIPMGSDIDTGKIRESISKFGCCKVYYLMDEKNGYHDPESVTGFVDGLHSFMESEMVPCSFFDHASLSRIMGRIYGKERGNTVLFNASFEAGVVNAIGIQAGLVFGSDSFIQEGGKIVIVPSCFGKPDIPSKEEVRIADGLVGKFGGKKFSMKECINALVEIIPDKMRITRTGQYNKARKILDGYIKMQYVRERKETMNRYNDKPFSFSGRDLHLLDMYSSFYQLK